MLKTAAQWRDYCAENITAGYTPGGKARDTYDTGVRMAQFLYKRGMVRDCMRVLDVGCGNGRLAMGLLETNLALSYLGLDVIKPCIDFCDVAFHGYEDYNFQHLDIKNAHYWPHGTQEPQEVVYPQRSSTADLVVAFSLFSHTENMVIAERNLYEMERVLCPGGSIFATWSFTTQPSDVKHDAAHTIYHINDVLNMLYHFSSYKFITLEEFNQTNPNQVGLWIKT